MFTNWKFWTCFTKDVSIGNLLLLNFKKNYKKRSTFQFWKKENQNQKNFTILFKKHKNELLQK